MVFGNDNVLRHLPFFEEVATHEEHQPEWRAATAGLVVLRLVDSWLEEGVSAAAPASWNVNAVRSAIDDVDKGTPMRAILGAIVDVIQVSPTENAHSIVPSLMAYARGLEYDAKWSLAVDVYETIVEYTQPVEEPDTVIMAHLQRGVCLRTLGRFDEATQAYATAGILADRVGDMMGILRARLGDAIVAMSRGNLPVADGAFAAVAADAGRSGHPEQLAMALDGRAAVAGFRGDYELTIQFAYDAMRISKDAIERDRILSNIGTAFHLLGIRSAARDAFLILSATAQEQYTRWSATLSLLTIAAEDRSELAFEQLRRSLRKAALPPDLETDYFIHLGRAHVEFGQDDLAQIAFLKAVELAEHFGLNRHLFEAETALTSVSHRGTGRSTDVAIPESVVDVADAVRSMRHFALNEK